MIDAMCKAYWNARGSTPWEKETEAQRDLIRERMRAAVAAQESYLVTVCETCHGTEELDQTLGGDARSGIVKCPDCKVPAPVNAPNHGSFTKISLQDALKISLESLY